MEIKEVFNSQLNPLYTAFLDSIKPSEYRIGINFDKYLLAVEQNNYLSKIVNIYIINDLNAWPRNPTNNFKFKNCLFGATNIVKIVIKKSMYIVDTELHLIVQVHGLLVITLLEML